MQLTRPQCTPCLVLVVHLIVCHAVNTTTMHSVFGLGGASDLCHAVYTDTMHLLFDLGGRPTSDHLPCSEYDRKSLNVCPC